MAYHLTGCSRSIPTAWPPSSTSPDRSRSRVYPCRSHRTMPPTSCSKSNTRPSTSGRPTRTLVRHDFLQEALHLAFDKLVSGSLPAPKTLATVLSPAVVQGRISFWSFHRRRAASPAPTRHRRLLPHQPRRRPAGRDDRELRRQQDRRVPAHLGPRPCDLQSGHRGSGLGGDDQADERRPDRGTCRRSSSTRWCRDLAPGTNRTWLTLYSPLVFENASIDGATETMSSGAELGVRAYSTYVDVPPGSTVTLRVQSGGPVGCRAALDVSARLQPAANPEHEVVEVTPAGAWELSASTAARTAGISLRRCVSVGFSALSPLDSTAQRGPTAKRRNCLTRLGLEVTFARSLGVGPLTRVDGDSDPIR